MGGIQLRRVLQLAGALAWMSLALGQEALAQATGDCSEADRAATGTWFPHDQTPEPSTRLTSDTNCAFHVWSWQMFLWLTQTEPSTGQPRFLSQYSLEELFAPLGAPTRESSEVRPLRLSPRIVKSDDVDVDEFQQAGSAGVLVDQDQRAVYYSLYVNRTFYDFVRKRFFDQEPGGTFDPALLAAATGVRDFYPPGALELKLSWKIVSGSPAGFFSTPAEVHVLKKVNGKIVVDPSTTQQVTVALVGMHVVGVVDDHPELIWATFEQSQNAPDLPAGVAPDSPQPVSDRSWTFYAADTAAKASNQNPGGDLQLDEATQKLTPRTDVFREFAFGTIQGGSGAGVNVANILALNELVSTRFLPASSPWKSYMEVGAIWMLPNTLEPNQFPTSQLRGSTMLSNSTMETYTQSGSQCFSCHNTLPVWGTIGGHRLQLPGTNFNLSHILVQEYFRVLAAGKGVSVRAVR